MHIHFQCKWWSGWSFFCPLLSFFNHSLLDDLPRRRPPQMYKPPTAEMIAYLDFSVSTTGMLTGVKVRNLVTTLKQDMDSVISQFI